MSEINFKEVLNCPACGCRFRASNFEYAIESLTAQLAASQELVTVREMSWINTTDALARTKEQLALAEKIVAAAKNALAAVDGWAHSDGYLVPALEGLEAAIVAYDAATQPKDAKQGGEG